MNIVIVCRILVVILFKEWCKLNEDLKSDEVYELLKRKIVKMEYEPGDVLNEVELATKYNMSRTPIRKILSQLNTEKLITIIPRFGAQVAPIDFKHMKSVFEVTRILDPFAAKLSADRLTEGQIKELEDIIGRLKSYSIEKDYQTAIDDDEKFHTIIYNNCGNTCITEILHDLHNHTERLWHYSEKYIPTMEIFYGTLEKILDAIKTKDYELIEIYSREHIDAFVENIKQQML